MNIQMAQIQILNFFFYFFSHGAHSPNILIVREPSCDKTNKMACVPSEDSDHTGHPPSLIRVFTVRMKKDWVLSYSLSAQ